MIISVMGVAGGMVKNILLARELSKDEFGLFSLLMTVVLFVNPLTLLGQHHAFVRFMSDKACADYAWKTWFFKKLLLILGLSVFMILIVYPIYNFTNISLLFLILATFSSALTDLYAAIYRAQGRYEVSMWVFQLLSLILPVAALLLLVTKIFTFNNILIVFALLYFATPSIIIALSNRRSFSGEQTLPQEVWRDGLFLWGMDLSFLIIAFIDRLLIPKLLTYDALGEYFAIFTLMRGFDLLQRAIEFVLFPHVKRSGKLNLTRNSLAILGFGLLLSAIYIAGGDFFVSLLFKGKYSNSAYLIPYFCILGSIRLLHAIPYSIIGGSMRQKRLKQMLYLNIATVSLAFVLNFILIQKDGLRGAVIASIILWTIKTLTGYAIIWRENAEQPGYVMREEVSSHV